MITRISLASALLAALVGSSAFAESDMNSTSTFMSKSAEIGILGVGLFEGSDDPLQSTMGFGLRAGYRFAPNWSAVAEVMATPNADYDSAVPTEVDVMDYIAGINYDVLPDNDFVTPFVSLGVGYRTVSDVDNRDTWNILPGIGVKILLSDSLQLLLEGKARFSLEEDEKGALATVGLSYRFGGAEEEPVAVEPEPEPVAAEPEPAPEPEPTPEPEPEKPVDVDSDNDGVLDSADNCPDTKSGLKVDGQGCPVTMNFTLHFNTESADLGTADDAEVEGFATFLKESPAYNVTLTGHADSRGTEAYNQTLSEKRADAAKAALVGKGVEDARITTAGKGESEPVADNATAEGQAQNRRVDAALSVE